MARRLSLTDITQYLPSGLFGAPSHRRMAAWVLGLVALASATLTGCATPGTRPAETAQADAAAAAPRLPWSPVDGAAGLLYAKDVATPGQVLHWLRLDLRDPTLALTLTPPRDRGQTLDQFEGATKALAAVNASFFTSRFEPRGWTVSAGEVWTPVLAAAVSPLLQCNAMKQCDMQLTPPVPAPPPGGLAVGGTPWLIRDGVARQPSDDASCAFCKVRHPRTAVGLDDARRFLTLVLVEGRQPGALGMTLSELAHQMRLRGVTQALNLDGGGSTALLLEGQLVTGRPFNEPLLRPLANALIIRRVSVAPLGDASSSPARVNIAPVSFEPAP